jgi:hypothetical protein
VTCQVIDPATSSACTNACHKSFMAHPRRLKLEHTPVGYEDQWVRRHAQYLPAVWSAITQACCRRELSRAGGGPNFIRDRPSSGAEGPMAVASLGNSQLMAQAMAASGSGSN